MTCASIRRRRFLFGLVAMSVLTGGWQTVNAATSRPLTAEGEGFAIPDAALVRPLGKIAPGTCAPPPAWQACQGDATPVEGPTGVGSIPGNYPMAVPGLGIPLGGVGAGSFMINQAGTFGPWNFGGSQGNTWETRILPQAAFHVREQLGPDPATVRTLATDGPANTGVNGKVSSRSWGSPLPAWHVLQPGDGSYAALYPFGWMTYKNFKSDVSMRFFSPIVAQEDRRTSLPVAYFDVRVANPTSETDNVSVMFTMPNAPDHVAGTTTDPSSPAGPASVRTGFGSSFQSEDGVDAVTLSADSPANTPDAKDSEWTIAAKPGAGQSVSYTTSWNANGDGSDVYAPFTRSGRLPDAPLDTSASAGAIAVSAHLAPGQVTTIPFVLAWDFPQVGFDNNQTIWMRRYTDFYGAKETSTNDYVPSSYPFHQSFNIARDALVDHDSNLAAVLSWWKPIATNPAYPPVLRTAALNELSQLVFDGSFWEGGLVSNTVIPTGFSSAGPGHHLDASRPGSHLWGIMIASGGGVANEGWSDGLALRGWTVYFKLFPNLMKDLLEANAEASKYTTYGNSPSSLYSVNGDPFITFGTGSGSTPGTQTVIQDGAAQPIPCETEWLDGVSAGIFEEYAYWKSTGDAAFLNDVYPALKGNLAYLQRTIPAGTYLPCDAPLFANYMDALPQGNIGAYNSGLYLLSLEIAISTGRYLHDNPVYLAGLEGDLAKAKAEFEATLWNPAQHYYRLNAAGPNAAAAYSGVFMPEYLAASLGLPDIVDQQHHRAELNGFFAQFLRRDSAGDLTGATNLEQPGGLESPLADYPPQSSSVDCGANYDVAADLYVTGKRYNRPDFETDAVQVASAVANITWRDDTNGFQFDAPTMYADTDPTVYNYPGTSTNLAAMDLLDVIDPIGT